MGAEERTAPVDVSAVPLGVLGQAEEGEAVTTSLTPKLRRMLDALARQLGDGDVDYGLDGIETIVEERKRERRGPMP